MTLRGCGGLIRGKGVKFLAEEIGNDDHAVASRTVSSMTGGEGGRGKER